MKFLIGSSYFHGNRPNREAFARVWHFNTLQTNPKPSRVVVIEEADSYLPIQSADTDVVHLTGDLGHIGDHLNGKKTHQFTGWSASMCALAMLAYVDEADFIYKEEDCLAFGPWVEHLYADLGDKDLVFGRRMTSPPWQVCSQALFLCRHRFIPTMVSEYLALGRDGHLDNTGENKFFKIEQKYPDRVGRHSLMCDRERPIPWDAPAWYAQQWSDSDLDEAKRRNLI